MVAVQERIETCEAERLVLKPSAIHNPRVASFYRHWLNIRNGRPMPGRADVDPTDFPYALGNAFIVQVDHRNPLPRFRFRLAGTLMVEVHKQELGGMWLEDVFEDFGPDSKINGDYFRVVTTRQPAYYAGKPSIRLDHQDRIERLLMPLSENSTRVDMILAMVVYYDHKGVETYY